jgi:SAM-dependent methyltransferase
MGEFEERFSANPQQAEYWNSVAGPKWVEYDAEMDSRLSPMTFELLRRSAIGPGLDVLDVGCGAGSTTEQIAHTVGPTGTVLGLDISEPLLSVARNRCAALSQVTFLRADAQVHPFATECFDVLMSRFGVMFFSDPFAAFANLLKALRPGGKLHFVCWASADKNQWFTVPLNVVMEFLGPPEPVPPRAPGPLAFSDRDYVLEILSAAGFRNIQIESVETTIVSPDSPEKQAELYLRMGPASRLVAAKLPGPEVMNAITAKLTAELRHYANRDGIAFGATVHYVAATA